MAKYFVLLILCISVSFGDYESETIELIANKTFMHKARKRSLSYLGNCNYIQENIVLISIKDVLISSADVVRTTNIMLKV